MTRAQAIRYTWLTSAAVLALIAAHAIAFQLATRSNAFDCALASDGSDQHIADCYTLRGLPCPEDICP